MPHFTTSEFRAELAQAGLFAPGADEMNLNSYDYPLPEGLIAQYPLEKRDGSRMLVLDKETGELAHRRFSDLPEFLREGDLLVLNNTKVLPARFYGNRQGLTGRVEILLMTPEGEADCWAALVRPAKKMQPGTIIEFAGTEGTMEIIDVGERGRCRLRIHPAEHGDVPTMMERVGLMPIPPYLRRDAEESDKERYQTVFSKVPGAQAAPTASLHFTHEILEALKARGVKTAEVTLAVSAGTFRTVEHDDVRLHKMDPEYYTIPPETAALIEETKRAGGRIIAIGTTVTKTLETSAFRLVQEKAEFSGGEKPLVRAESGWSDLFIYPGFQYRVVDVLLTNFHLPKSTLLMLVSAFCSREKIAGAYRTALEEEYRFFSYGDCMLIQ